MINISLLLGGGPNLSSTVPFEQYRELLDEIDSRYSRARDGYDFDFKSEIEPFLNNNKQLAYHLESIKTDERLTPIVRQTMSDELMELLMSCHIPRFSLKLYYEKFKYINMWINHANVEGLL